MVITNMRERIKAIAVPTDVPTDEDGTYIGASYELSWHDRVDRFERLFNEMLAEQKVGNGS
jgi:hypothetical protein